MTTTLTDDAVVTEANRLDVAERHRVQVTQTSLLHPHATVVDTIADNAADAGIVTGGRPVRPYDVDLRWVGALLYRNGTLEETGVAAGVLDHPARGLVWLARRYGDQGLTLEAEQTVLSGSFTRPSSWPPATCSTSTSASSVPFLSGSDEGQAPAEIGLPAFRASVVYGIMTTNGRSVERRRQ